MSDKSFAVHHPELFLVPSGQRVPVRRVLCVGRNYAAHAAEMGDDGREPPFFFAKSFDAVLPTDDAGVAKLAYPPRSSSFHHEVEHVVLLGLGGRDLSVAGAANAVFAEGVGLDMTRRDVQGAAKAAGRPWMTGKDFDGSAVVGPLVRCEGSPRERGEIRLSVNGERRQTGDLGDRIWNVAELISELSGWMTLHPGDLVFTGTPSGVGPVRIGDEIEAEVEGLPPIRVLVTG